MDIFTKEIYRELQKSKKPLSLDDLYINTLFEKSTIKRHIDDLIKNNLVESSKIDNKTYYKPIRGDDKKLKEVKEDLVVDTVIAVSEVKELREKIKSMDNNINLIYINIITIIALFISIFSIITINTNTIAKLVESMGDNVIKPIVIINLSMVGSITIILLLLNQLIIKPLKNKSK